MNKYRPFILYFVRLENFIKKQMKYGAQPSFWESASTSLPHLLIHKLWDLKKLRALLST